MTEQLWLPDVELRAAPGGFCGTLVPYGETSYLTEYRRGERFSPGSFAEAVRAVEAGEHIPLWIDHDTNRRPAGWVAKLQEAARGLAGVFRCHPSVEGRTALESVSEGRAGLSVGFSVREEAKGDDGARVVVRATLVHVALVPEPAYETARAEPVLATRSAYLSPVASHVPGHLAALWQ